MSAFWNLSSISIHRSKQHRYSEIWRISAFRRLNSTIHRSKQYRCSEIWRISAFWGLNSISIHRSKEYQHSEVWTVSEFTALNSIGIHKVRLQTHTYNILNNYCFPTATMVRRMRLNVTLCYTYIGCLFTFIIKQTAKWGFLLLLSSLWPAWLLAKQRWQREPTLYAGEHST
jgi:hypothetical protein